MRTLEVNRDCTRPKGIVIIVFIFGDLIIDIQCPQVLSVVQTPFNNFHSPFTPTTLIEIAVRRSLCVAGHRS